jgi:hypothetical protein
VGVSCFVENEKALSNSAGSLGKKELKEEEQRTQQEDGSMEKATNIPKLMGTAERAKS